MLILNLQLGVLRVQARFDELKENVIALAGAMEEKQAIPMVRDQLLLIQEVQTTQFWQGVTVPELESVRLRLRALVKFIDKKRREPVYTNFEDMLRGVESVPLPVISAGVDSDRLREKALAFLRNNMEHPALHKVRWNEPLTQVDLNELERFFVESGTASIEQLRETVKQDGGLGLFIRSLVGLDRAAAKRAFSGFIDGRTDDPGAARFCEFDYRSPDPMRLDAARTALRFAIHGRICRRAELSLYGRSHIEFPVKYTFGNSRQCSCTYRPHIRRV